MTSTPTPTATDTAELPALAERMSRERMLRPKIITFGVFDLFHAGHHTLVQRLGVMGHLTVAVVPDEFCEQYKGFRPDEPLHTRMATLQRHPYVSHVVVHRGGHDFRTTVLQVSADLVAVGSDWAPPARFDTHTSLTHPWLEQNDIGLLYLPRTPGVSSSQLREANRRGAGR